jgi:hypothetical protein
MRVGILQPYLLPYIGYFQLIAHVDQIVFYDDAQYTKKGWINRNRFQTNGVEQKFTVPLERASDFLEIRDRRIAPSYSSTSILNQMTNAYRKAPNFPFIIELLKEVFEFPERNLFSFILNSIKFVNNYLDIKTPITVSSEVDGARDLRGQDRVIKICQELGAKTYINPKNVRLHYNKQDFEIKGIELLFLESQFTEYHQSTLPFLPALSILDVMMMLSVSEIKSQILEDYILFAD